MKILAFFKALFATEQAALSIPVVAMSPAGKIISIALVGEEVAQLFLAEYHAAASAASAAPVASAVHPAA